MNEKPADATVRAWVRLTRAQQRAQGEIEAALKQAGLPPLAWYDVLLETERAGKDGLRPFELERAMLLAQYNLSRLVDRMAAEGLVERRRGRGTSVAKRVESRPVDANLSGLIENLLMMGLETAVEILAFDYVAPPDAVRAALVLAEGVEVQRAVRVRRLDGIPLSYTVSHVPAELGRSYQRADLAKAPLLRSDDELWRPWFDAAGLTDWPEPKRGVLYQDSSNLLQAAIDGQGIALTRRSLAMHEVASGRLVRLFDIDGPSPWQYFFICTPQMLQTARVKAFRDWVFDEVARFRQLFESACTENAMRSVSRETRGKRDTQPAPDALHVQLPAAQTQR